MDRQRVPRSSACIGCPEGRAKIPPRPYEGSLQCALGNYPAAVRTVSRRETEGRRIFGHRHGLKRVACPDIPVTLVSTDELGVICCRGSHTGVDDVSALTTMALHCAFDSAYSMRTRHGQPR